jgi:histidinol-phosphatase (PHP family)
VLDYHLHLWPHGEHDQAPTLEVVAAYCERAATAGVHEIALTEHLFRFVQADRVLRGFWEDEPDAGLRDSMKQYWDDHAHADLDAYVACVEKAKSEGLPVVLGLEVDYYRGRMDEVAEILEGYPFDVLLGSVHWVGVWRFDDLRDPASMAEWSVRDVDDAWNDYTTAIEELAASGVCDVLAHPDLVKVTGKRPEHPEECWDRLTEAARESQMAAELSSAGWRKPVGEAYPDRGLLERLVGAGVPLTTASDAHGLPDVADRSQDLARILDSVGVTSLRAFRRREPFDVAVSATAAAAPGPAADRAEEAEDRR